ncbi:hypothetical protein [Enterobacter hormaechei]|uniref:hypothetical protein n=1 Tax=Enterobacter hormaechei TaxID=158836 RepID=UPI0007B3BDBF|nr:hypothetical protein [Enterobacter hormaechei]KZP84510.1 hypothetical protein A3N47_09935 [Enterobacter hormaechei subsp. xiangfangensis]RTM57446.1 hypothetical protein EKO17_23685 [Enterobacter hormaechei subsp. xiangfangensis]
MNSSYESLVTKITSKEIADAMLAHKEWITARELSEILRKQYPGRIVEVNDVYKRLVEFCESFNAHCKVDTSERPRRFRLYSIRKEYFNELRRQLARKGVPEFEISRLLGGGCDTEEDVARAWKYAHDLFDNLHRRQRTCRQSVITK